MPLHDVIVIIHKCLSHFIRYGVFVCVYALYYILALRACVRTSECVAFSKFISLIKLTFCSLAFSIYSARSCTSCAQHSIHWAQYFYLFCRFIFSRLLFDVLKISNAIFKECAIKRWKIRSSACDHNNRQSHDLQIKALPFGVFF